MGFLKDLVGGITGSTQADAAKKAGRIQQETAQQAIDEQIIPARDAALSRFDPLSQVAQQGINQAGFLTDPNAQFQFIQDNPLFQLGLDNLNEQTLKGAAARGRVTAGDTLQQLTQNATLASQPLIDRQRQDILNLLNLGQGVAGQQANIGLGSANQITDLLTGGASARAAGTVGAANARSGTLGNIVSLGSTPLSSLAPKGSIFSGIGGLFGGTSSPQANSLSGFGSGLNLSQTPLGINTNAGSFGG